LENGNWNRGGKKPPGNGQQRTGTAGLRRRPQQKRTLDKEVECEEEEAEDKKEGAEGEAALREAADGMEKAGRDHAEARFRARKVKGADGFVAGKIAAEGGKFIFHPQRDFFAIAPQI
jgi:hypothetical protein